MGSNTAEIDLTGLDDMIKKTNDSIGEMSDKFSKLGNTVKKIFDGGIQEKFEKFGNMLKLLGAEGGLKMEEVFDKAKDSAKSLDLTVTKMIDNLARKRPAVESIINAFAMDDTGDTGREAFQKMSQAGEVFERRLLSLKKKIKDVGEYIRQLPTKNQNIQGDVYISDKAAEKQAAKEYWDLQQKAEEKWIAFKKQSIELGEKERQQTESETKATESAIKHTEATEKQAEAQTKAAEAAQKAAETTTNASKQQTETTQAETKSLEEQLAIIREKMQAEENFGRWMNLRKKEKEVELQLEERQRQEAQKKEEARLRYEKKLSAQEELVAQGNQAAISSYLKQEMSLARLKNALNGLQNAQSQCNRATADGEKRWKELEAEITAVNMQIRQLEGGTNKFRSVFSKLSGMASQVAMSFGVMTGVFGATQFVRSLYRITGEFQLQQRALAAIVNESREANRLFKQMQQLATESPMKLMNLNKYAKQLAAFKIETNNLYDSLKMLGDISTGVGVDMDRLILAYGQVKAANYLRGQELRQFSEAGVNILGGLRDYYRDVKGITYSINEIFDNVSKRKVLFEDVDTVLKRMTESGGAFYNMQLIQSQTLYGQTQKLADLYQIEMNNIGKSTSGVLLAFVKIAQSIVKNLSDIVSIAGVIGGGVLISKFAHMVDMLRRGTFEASRFHLQLKGIYALLMRINKVGFLKGVGQAIGEAIRGMSKLNLIIGAVTAAVAIGGTIWRRVHEERKRALEETIDVINQYNARYRELSEIEANFNKSRAYKERLALLQELVEKAKEYNYQMALPEHINEGNINEVFKTLNENMQEYIKGVSSYTSALQSPKISKSLENLNKLTSDSALAIGEADNALDFYYKHYAQLGEKQQQIFDTITKMREDFNKDEEKAVEEYGMTKKKFELYVVEQVNAMNQQLQRLSMVGKDNGIWAEYKKQFGIGFWDENFTPNAGRIAEFVSSYVKQIGKVEEKIKKHAKGIDFGMFDGLSGEALEKKITDEFPKIFEVFKDKTELLKPELAGVWAKLFDVDEGLVYTVLFNYQHGKTDLEDPEWRKRIDELIRDGKIDVEVDVKVKERVLDKHTSSEPGYGWMDLYKEDMKQFGEDIDNMWVDVIKTQEVNITEFLNPANYENADDYKKALDDMIKTLDSFVQMFNDDAVDFAFANSLFAINFGGFEYDSLESAKKGTAELKKAYEDMRETLFGKPKDKTKNRTYDITSQYRSMVDFIKKLNTEYEKLRKNFDKDESGGFMGAFDRIIESYKGEFGEMPKRFREAFGESIANIDFSTKEGSKKGEQIVKSIIEGAKDLTQKQKDELKRYVERAIGDITLDIDVKAKKESDERLNAQVQKMFDDYNLTVELKKLDINPDALGKMFNINTKDLATLQRQVESLAEQFTGEEQEKKYREYMRKIVEINDKANLEMAKNYSKYLREEFGERAKLELEYMRKRAEIYALPFDDEQQSRIIENLQKETQEKLDKLEWDKFRGSDYYVEMFEDLGRVSTQALQGMIDKLGEMRGKLSELSPTEYKTLVEQMQKITDELVRRNPFKALVTAIGEIRRVQGSDSEEGRLIRTWLGLKPDEKIRNFYKSFQQALNNIRLNLQQAESEGNLTEKLLGAARERDEAIKSLKSGGALADLSEIDFFNVEKLQEKEKDLKDEYDRLTEIINTGLGGVDPTKDMEKRNAINSTLKILGSLISNLQTLEEEGKTSVSTSTLEQSLRVIKQKIAEYKEQADKLGDVDALIKDQQEDIKQLAEDWQDAMGKVKTTFDTVFDNLDYLGGTTDGVTEAWKELGDTIFDTVIQSIGLIAQFAAAAVAGETAINSAAGWIGLIAEAVTLIVTGISQIFKIKDAKIAKEMETIQKNMDKLKKTAEDLKGVFDNLFNEEELRAYDAAIIKTKELYIEQLEEMIRSEESKKKSDQAAIDGWRDEIESTYDEIKEQTEDFYNSVGGLGGQSEMKAQAEEWTNAWYEAFKETGDGLQGLEDSFDSFLDEIFKKQILNQLSSKYFKDLFEKLNTILGTGGGLQSNIDDFTDWVDDVHEQFGRFSEEAQQLAEIFYGAGGLGGGLEGLQASIQGMTEQTAELLAAYLNSIRFYVSDNSEQIAALTEALTVDNGTNPIIEQLKVIAQQTTSINLLLDSVVRPSGWTGTGSGAYIKVGFGQMPQ